MRIDLETELLAQPRGPGGRHDQRPAGAPAADPAALEQRAEHRGAERAGEVRAALGPVHAGAGERPPAGGERAGVDAERLERRGIQQREALRRERAERHEALGDGDAEAAGEVVVTGAGRPVGGRAIGGAQAEHGRAWRDEHERLDGLGHLVAGEPVHAPPAGSLHGDQAGGLEPREVRAGGRGSDAGGARQGRRGPGLAAEQLEHDRGPGPVPERAGDVAELDLLHGADSTPGTVRRGTKRPPSRVAG